VRLSQEFTTLCRERDPIVATVEQPHAKFTLEIVYLELTGGWLMPSRAAAPPKCSSSAAARKYRR
jgi:hypothetical protein